MHETKTKLSEKTDESSKLKKDIEDMSKSLKVFTESKVIQSEQLLGKLHEFVSDLTKDIEMTEVQEGEYQSIMGSLDESMKLNETQKHEAVKKFEEQKSICEQIELKLEDNVEKIKQLEEQNALLKEQSKDLNDKQKEMKVMENQEFDKIVKELEDKERVIIEKSQEIGIAKDKLKQVAEELDETRSKYVKAKEDNLSFAKQVSELQETGKNLEMKYKNLKEKYSEARTGVLKKYESRYLQKEKELEATVEAKYKAADASPSGNNTQASASEGDASRTSKDGTSSEEKAKMEQQLGGLQKEVEMLRKEVEDLLFDKKEREQEMDHVSKQLEEMMKKNVPAKKGDAKLDDSFDKQSEAKVDGIMKKAVAPSISYNINPKRLILFLDDVEPAIKLIYKEFLKLSTSSQPTPQAINDIQLKLNKIAEAVADFKDYALLKLEEAAKKKPKPPSK